MEFLLLVFFSLLTGLKVTFGNENEPNVIKVTVEGSDVILPCSLSSKESIMFQLFEWKKDDQKQVFMYDSGLHTNNDHPGQDKQFKGRVSHFEDELKSGNASIIIRNTKVADSGDYTCDFPLLQQRQIFHIKLHVVDGVLKDRTAENIPGLATKPYVTSLKQKADWALLLCQVRGASPKPKLHWQDSDGKKLPAEEPKVTERRDRYDVILLITVTKTDNYRCVVTQEEIKHQIYSEIYAFVFGPDVIRVTVEGNDVILPCSLSSKENIVLKSFVWKKDDQKVFAYDAGRYINNDYTGQDEQFKGRVSHFKNELKSGDASIIIRNTEVADSGDYTCDFPQLQPRQISHIKLFVGGVFKDRTTENIPGAALEPYVTPLKQTMNWALLQCEVRDAFPKPKLHWQDSDGNILHAEEPKVSERGGRYDVILQTNVTKTDNYFCVATQEEINHQTYADIYVFISEPNVIKVIVEGSDVILPCSLSSKESIVFKSFVWKKDDQKQVFVYNAGIHSNNDYPGQDEQFKGRVSHFDDELKSGNASIIIRNTKVADSGDYTCDFPQLQPRQIFHIKLHVGAATKPSVMTLYQTADSALLQCQVRGAFPKPKLHWQDSDGNILHDEEPKVTERGGHYDVILQTNVTKTDNYRCVATQEEIRHQIYAETYVYIHDRVLKDRTAENIPGAAPEPYVKTLNETQYWSLLKCEVRGAFPKPKLHWQDSDGNILHAEEPKVTERGDDYDVILQTTVTKINNYRCVATQLKINHQIYAEIHVNISKPNFINVIVGEGSDAILPCSLSSKENIEFEMFEWNKDDQKQVFAYDAGLHTNNDYRGQDEQFKGRVSRFKDELKSGDASIIIRNMKVADSGDYTCDFPQLQPRQIFHIKLHVVNGILKDRRAENIPGAAPKPSVTPLKQTMNWVLLQCEVQAAFPKPKLHWQDSDGKILYAEEPKVTERGGRYDIILQINVTKTDNYRCVATQEKIKHQIYAEIYVIVVGAATKPYVMIVDQTADWALLQCQVRGASPKPKLHWEDSDGNILHAEEPKETERGGDYDVILQTTVNKTDNYRCVATQEEISHQIYAETHVSISEPNVIKVIVEGSDVILPCSLSSKESIVFKSFVWKKDDQKEVFMYDAGLHTNNDYPSQDEQFKGRVSHFKDELKSGNASIIIRNTKVADSGDYTCDFPLLQQRQIFHIKLHVGAATKPYVMRVDQTKDWALLQCQVRGASPKPKLHWEDSDGKKLPAEEPKESEREGRYDVILQTTVTKTDYYRCVAMQKEIKHQIYSEIHAILLGEFLLNNILIFK
ncbi:hemicentin-1-like [Thunnus thynnus]|uniref:hemicentin-1-like n=1 Tax=Thunnus thynnus TaxID=8237 RepID=UPI0035293E27